MQEEIGPIWDKVSALLKNEIGGNNWLRWFAHVRLTRLDAEQAELEVPNTIHQFFIESNYLPILKTAIMAITGVEVEVFVRSPQTGQPDAPCDDSAFFTDTPDCASGNPANDGRVINPANSAETEEKSGSRRNGKPGRSVKELAIASDMNRHYVFDEFVVGAGNEFAHAAALAVANAPAKRYNPLFLYGGSGLGKTHLMHAVGLQVLQAKQKKKVIFISCEEFTNEFISAIQTGQLVQFRKRFRRADVLLIDDIHFLAGKERSQEEFFHTFNTLFDGHKQIVMSSDKMPNEINGLERRLVSRFEWGLTAQLMPPDVETRHAILRKKAQRMKIPVTDAVLNFLAAHIRTNVRRLEGALNRVASYSSLSSKELDVEEVEQLLGDFLRQETRPNVTADEIQKKVAKHYDIRLADMTSRRRPANIAGPRQIAMYLCRQLTDLSLVDIGEAFGGRDHGTILHAIKTVEKKMKENDKMRQAVTYLSNQLAEGS